jgi:hypothetical protein
MNYFGVKFVAFNNTKRTNMFICPFNIITAFDKICNVKIGYFLMEGLCGTA